MERMNETTRQIDRTKIVGGVDPFTTPNFAVKCADGVHEWRSVLNLTTFRKAEHRAILKELYGGTCSVCGQEPDPTQSPADHATGPRDLDHLDGNTRNNNFANFAGLCHHSCNPRRYHAEQKGQPVKATFAQGGMASASLENVKSEEYLRRFRVAAPAYFALLEPGAIVSELSFKRAMVGACSYVDDHGLKHEPNGVTIGRYVSDRIYPDNPDGLFSYGETLDHEEGIFFVRRPQTHTQVGRD